MFTKIESRKKSTAYTDMNLSIVSMIIHSETERKKKNSMK